MEFDFKNVSLQNRVILDFGCGSGLSSLYFTLIAGASKVFSIDEFEGRGAPIESYQRLQRILNIYDLTRNITLIKADGVSHDFKQQKFDIIYCSYVLHHIFPKQPREDTHAILNCLKKFKQLLIPRGFLIIREVMRHNITEFLPRRIAPLKVRWESKRDAKEWVHFLRQAGFSKISVRYYAPYFLNIRPLNKFIENKFASFTLNSRYVLECICT